jgi:hypothetical protein
MRIRSSKRKLLAAFAIGVTATLLATAPASASGNYSWCALGSDDDWDTESNWAVDNSATSYYPDDEQSNAAIPIKSGDPWTINLIAESIGDTEVRGNTDFSTAGGTPALTVNKFTIIAGNSGVVVTISGATIATR